MEDQDATIDDFLESSLHRMLQAENQICDQLQIAAQYSDSEQLKKAISEHLEETKGQVQRLEDCLDLIEKPNKEEGLIEKGKKMAKKLSPIGKKSKSIEGIMEEGAEVFKKYEGTPLNDLVLVSGLQAVEMGEIASYRTLCFLAKEAGYKEIFDFLQETLKEEEKVYDLLNQILQKEVKNVKKSA